ncbi:hypothetical protein [Burkholderia sp. BCC0322]|uniref:hypothetical protein n=1 Tax=unclassified Burkholderia TaxID=2613784 RepID=UPI00158F0305|nr:hypothetical protein [Burkholderia sp. BCC0322]
MKVTYSAHNKEMMLVCGTFDAVDTLGNLRILSDDERLLVAGAGNPWGAVVGGLQGSVVGGIGGAVTGPMLGVPWTVNGLAGMATGAIQGAFAGWSGPR